MPENERSGCAARRHGTRSAYNNDDCRCGDATRDASRYTKLRRAGIHQPRFIDPTGTHRKLKALQALGHTWSDIAADLEHGTPSNVCKILTSPKVNVRTAQLVDQVYEKLCMTPGPSTRTATRAQQKGWLRPLAWDDIDSDPEPPAADDVDNGEVDPSAVTRVITGNRPKVLRSVDRRAAVAELTRRGMTRREIADQVRCPVSTVDYDRACLKAGA